MGHEILSPRQWATIQAALKLADREMQVTKHVFDESSEAAIAADLGISKGTVHTYLSRLYLRLRVHGRSGLIVRVFETYLAAEDHRPRSAGSGD